MKGYCGSELAQRSRSLPPLYTLIFMGKIIILYTAKAKTAKLRSSFICPVMKSRKKSYLTPIFSPLYLTCGYTISTLTPIIFASFLRVPNFGFQTYTLSGHWSSILRRIEYSSTVGVKSSSLKVKHLHDGSQNWIVALTNGSSTFT